MSDQRKIKELYPRAPRYMIEIGDNEVVRFALKPRGSKTMHTRIINLSESGMAFLCPYLNAPQESEVIKVEFTAPNTQPIACFAKVVRVQVHKTYRDDQKPQTFKMIAVEFENLPAKQRQMLSQGLTQQFKKKHAAYQRKQLFLKAQWHLTATISNAARIFEKLFSKKTTVSQFESSHSLENSDKKTKNEDS